MSEQPPTPDPDEADVQDPGGEPEPQPGEPEPRSGEREPRSGEREAQADDPTSPLRGFEDPEDAERQPGHAEDN